MSWTFLPISIHTPQIHYSVQLFFRLPEDIKSGYGGGDQGIRFAQIHMLPDEVRRLLAAFFGDCLH